MAGGRKARAPPPPSRTLVLDNGSFNLKAGFASDSSSNSPAIIPNCIARDRNKKLYVGSGLDKCRDFGEIQFRRPGDKGYIVNWEAQKEIWDHEFFDENAPLRCDPSDTRLILTEPPNSLPSLQSNCDQIVFEEYQFASFYRAIGQTFTAYLDTRDIFHTEREPDSSPRIPAEAILVIDSGYSHTLVTPLLYGRPLHSAVRRLDVGGKLMTNYMTRLLSLRHYDMRNDIYIVNELKEKACYVSLDFAGDLEKTWKGTRGEKRESYLTGAGIAKDYVLPDFHSRPRGVLRAYDPAARSKSRKLAASSAEVDEDIITLRNERFTVPELLFHPSDMGLRQSGLADLVMQSLSELPVGMWPALLANIVVIGGNSLLEGFIERLQMEIVQRAPDVCHVRIARPVDPITSTWHGGAGLAQHPHINQFCVNKSEYEEYGSAWVAHKFSSPSES